MARQSYWSMLKDPRWQKMRLDVMQRDSFTCQYCGDTTTTLNVHHTYYERGKAPWEYPLESLECLCEPCHEEAEDERLQFLMLLSRLTRQQRKEAFKELQLTAGKWVDDVSVPVCGEWEVMIVESKMLQPGSRLNLVFRVLKSEQTIRQELQFDGAKRAASVERLREISRAVGVWNPSDSSELHNKPMRVLLLRGNVVRASQLPEFSISR